MINHIWQSTWFAIAAGLLTLAFRKNGAQVRYALWFAASVKFLVPFFLLTSIGKQFEMPSADHQAPTFAIAQTVVEVSQPFSGPSTVASTSRNVPDWIPIALGCTWICGFTGVIMIRLRNWRAIRAAIRHSVQLDVPTIPKSIEVRMSTELLGPSVIGLLRPVLLLPAGIADRLTPAQFEAVVAHEISHIRRRDNLTAAIHMVVEALFWFHPLVWWIGARMLEERERACDEGVLRLGNQPGDYVEGILSVCKLYIESPLPSVAGVTGSNLKKRIEAILTKGVSCELSFVNKVTLAVAAIVAIAAPVAIGILPAARAQSPDSSPKPKFDVASIRPCSVGPVGEPGGEGKGGLKSKRDGEGVPGLNRMNFCAPLRQFIMIAYNPRGVIAFPDIVQGGPGWIDSDRYQINAKTERIVSSVDIQSAMLQALLEDRFQLKLHRETREVPGYVLTVAKGGIKMPPVPEGSCISLDPKNPPVAPPPIEKVCGPQPRFRSVNNGVRTLLIHGYTLPEFALFASGMSYRPVTDKTGVPGRFDFHLEFVMDDSVPGAMVGPPPEDPSRGPSFFTALQEQLGLKLEPAKGMRDYLVIDHVERPSEN
jgi:uncharacterized protein (TIGR03435 family)